VKCRKLLFVKSVPSTSFSPTLHSAARFFSLREARSEASVSYCKGFPCWTKLRSFFLISRFASFEFPLLSASMDAQSSSEHSLNVAFSHSLVFAVLSISRDRSFTDSWKSIPRIPDDRTYDKVLFGPASIQIIPDSQGLHNCRVTYRRTRAILPLVRA